MDFARAAYVTLIGVRRGRIHSAGSGGKSTDPVSFSAYRPDSSVAHRYGKASGAQTRSSHRNSNRSGLNHGLTPFSEHRSLRSAIRRRQLPKKPTPRLNQRALQHFKSSVTDTSRCRPANRPKALSHEPGASPRSLASSQPKPLSPPKRVPK